VRYERCAIPDVGTIDTAGYRAILDLIRSEAGADRPVYVHCWGGVGRTGTVVGCLLVDAGLDPDDVPAKLAELRAGTRKADRRCPETEGQSAVIAGWVGRGD
jgi:protein-tyrosine phosphatase